MTLAADIAGPEVAQAIQLTWPVRRSEVEGLRTAGMNSNLRVPDRDVEPHNRRRRHARCTNRCFGGV